VFLTRAREAEAALGAARSQAADLRAALDEHRGPWFEEVAAGVEERVRAAMARADALQRELAEAREAAAATEQVRSASCGSGQWLTAEVFLAWMVQLLLSSQALALLLLCLASQRSARPSF
jgi:hypothetical protein